MKRPKTKTQTVPVRVRLSELASVLNYLPWLSPKEAEAFAADIEEARRQLPPAEAPPEPPDTIYVGVTQFSVTHVHLGHEPSQVR